MRIILIGNYPPDRQESMERFTLVMNRAFKSVGIETEIWRPIEFFGSWFRSTNHGFGKWMGYIDKWVVFPFILKWRLFFQGKNAEGIRFHICDHSNAPYLQHLPRERTAITCHDVLAIRGALGYQDAYCSATALGKVLQKWILKNLTKARLLASVSHFTIKQLKELAPESSDQSRWKVIHNSFNANFKPLSLKESEALLEKAGIPKNTRYLLHVGSGLPRKNRSLLLNMLVELGESWNGIACFAGERPDNVLIEKINSLGLKDKVLFIANPNHDTLVALYSGCEAFIFPSFSEGFGWPVIEAQACGAPVIASSLEPMPEVSGGAALFADPNDPSLFAKAFLSLSDTTMREDLIRRGFANSRNFDQSIMIKEYLELHGLQSVKI